MAKQKLNPTVILPLGPLSVEPYQYDHGASIAICHRERGVLALIEPLNVEDNPDMHSAKREPWDEAYAKLFAASPDMLTALRYVAAMMEHAHKQFNWKDSALDVKAIQMLNEAPILVYNAIKKAEWKVE